MITGELKNKIFNLACTVSQPGKLVQIVADCGYLCCQGFIAIRRAFAYCTATNQRSEKWLHLHTGCIAFIFQLMVFFFGKTYRYLFLAF